MDINTLVTIVVSGLLGFFMVKFFQVRKELAQAELDRRLDDIYSDMGRMRDHIDEELQKVSDLSNKRTLVANVELLKGNAKLAAQIASFI